MLFSYSWFWENDHLKQGISVVSEVSPDFTEQRGSIGNNSEFYF
jgi:hypothetical protein